MAPSTDRIVVGLDIGTTFTGVCFAYSNAPNDVEVITTWPGGIAHTCEKVPSESTYVLRRTSASRASVASLEDNTSNIVIDSLQELFHQPKKLKGVRWGFQIKHGEQRIKCLKLFLDRNQLLPSFVSSDDTLNTLKEAGRNVIDAMADFLAKVNGHLISTLRQRYGDAFVKSTAIDYILTVPAIWSDAAQNATKQAALRAGIGPRMRMISEPEAAAVHALKATQPNGLSVGDNIVVCDAGGGTVDLISYRISGLNPISVKESQIGSGGLCGSVFLNYRFQAHVRDRLGHQAFDQFVRQRPIAWHEAMERFDTYVKRNFEDTEELEEFNIPLNGYPENEPAGVIGGYLILEADQVKEIFEPIVMEIIRLVESEVASIHARDELVSSIVLVGGFGQSEYLHSRLKRHFVTNHPPPYSENSDSRNQLQAADKQISVLKPINAWTATARGAVLRGLEGPIVLTRKCRYHYGVKVSEMFDAGVHEASQKFWDSLDEYHRAKDVMTWMIAKDEEVSERRTVTFAFCRKFKDDNDLETTERIHASSSSNAPAKFNGNVFKVCDVTVDLRSVPRRFFVGCMNSGGITYRKLYYFLTMTIDSAELEFSLHVNGNCYGRAKADFDHVVS